MRSVSGTLRNPVSVFNAAAHRTEWTMTKTSDGVPRPNHINANGNRAMAGTGLNMAVNVDNTSDPIRVDTATVVIMVARKSPAK